MIGLPGKHDPAAWPATPTQDDVLSESFTHSNVFQNYTIEFTYRAAAIAIFGGYGHEVHHCIVRGGTDSSGIRFTEDFSGYHFQNNTGITLYQNCFDGQGMSRDLWNNPRGAIEIHGAGVKALAFDDNEILNSPRHPARRRASADLRQHDHPTDRTRCQQQSRRYGDSLIWSGRHCGFHQPDDECDRKRSSGHPGKSGLHCGNPQHAPAMPVLDGTRLSRL